MSAKTKGVGAGSFDARIIDRYFAKGREVAFFGKTVTDMTKDQLIAAIGCAMEEMQNLRLHHQRDLESLRTLRPPLQVRKRKSLRERIVGALDTA